MPTTIRSCGTPTSLVGTPKRRAKSRECTRTAADTVTSAKSVIVRTTSPYPPSPVMSRAITPIMTSRRSRRIAAASASGSVTQANLSSIVCRVTGEAANAESLA